MQVGTGIILIWTGSNANIPSGWDRETSLDDKYPKAWGNSVAPDNTGGNATHTHTSSAHSHTINSHTHLVTTANNSGHSVGDSYGSGSELVNAGNHYHYNVPVSTVNGGGGLSSVTSTYASFSNDPPYYKVIFIKSTVPRIFPNNAVCLYSGGTVPSNYYLCDGNNSTPDLRDKYLKGASAGADAGTTGGTRTNVHSLTHTHSETPHTHSQSFQYYHNRSSAIGTGGNGNKIIHGHWHTYSLASASSSSIGDASDLTTVETVEPVYKKLIAIQKSSAGILVKGVIALWLGSPTSLPRGWVLCDGTNDTQDMRDNFLKIGTGTSQIGNTGGSNTHTHSAQAHSHAGGSHTHSASSATNNHDGGQNGAGGSWTVDDAWDSTHTITSIGSTTLTWANSNTSGDSSDNQPPYRTVAYIQLNKIIGGMCQIL